MIRKRCEELHPHPNAEISRYNRKIKSLPEVYHPACERSAGSTSLSLFSLFFLLFFWAGVGGRSVSHTLELNFSCVDKINKILQYFKKDGHFLIAYN